MLNDEILEKYIHNFYGYGNLNSNYWFISLEEGEGNSAEETKKRLEVWEKRGGRSIEECKEFHIEFGKTKWFIYHPATQPVWRRYIRFYHYLINDKNFINSSEQNEIIRKYQRDKFGKLDGEFSILELRPLPAPNVVTWKYGNISNLSYLNNRETYKDYIDNFRIEKIKTMIEKHRPKNIFFFGTSEKDKWKQIIQKPIKKNTELDFYFSNNELSEFYILKHTVSKGTTNKYFENVAQFIYKK